MYRLSLLLGLFIFSLITCAQVNDSFDDNDFTTGTIWSGESSVGNSDAFEIVEADNQLKSQALSGSSGTRISYLSTTDAQDLSSTTAEWDFRFRLDFSRPSSSSSTTNGNNTSRVYLMSNTADLSGDLNGYFVELRYPGTSDFNEVRLYRQDAGTTTELALSGTVQTVTSQDFASVNITRSELGVWEVTVNSTSQGTVTDNTYNSSTHFGVQIRYSANSRSGLFYYDDFATTYSAVADTDPPTLSSSSANSATEVVLEFNEGVDETTAETASNYSFDNGATVSNAERNTSDNNQVTLTVSSLTNGTTYTVTVNNVEDESGNAIAANSTSSFEYIQFSTAGHRDIVINELMIDESPVVGLPEAEFIELYNPTDNFYALENWGISDDENPTSSEKLGAYTLRPDSYVIICDDADESLFTGFGDVLVVSSLGALTNSGDVVVLTNDTGAIIDQLTYSSAPSDGITYEQVNPELPCSGEFNFSASTNANGGTPGAQNSVFDSSADTEAPTVNGLQVIDTDSIQITFSEPLEESSVLTGSFSLSGFTIVAVSFSSDAVVDILLGSDLVSENTYSLEYTGITDCSGNALSDESTEFYYDVTAPQLDRLVVATNNAFFLIFNEPLQESEAETESNFSLNQSVGEPSRAILQDSASNRILVEFATEFSEGTTYALTFNALEDTTGNAISSTNEAFTFQDQIDSVYALSSNLLQITFTTTPSSGSASNQGNYLLEEVGNPSDVLTGGDDRTYRLVFDAAMDDNTDLLLFVENVLTSDASDSLITPAFSFRYDTDSPSLTSLNVTSSTQLELVFDEALEANTATNLNNYDLEDDEKPIEATLIDNTVTLTFTNDFETELEKTLTYTQIEDLYGNSFTSNRNVDFTYDPLAPRIDSIYQASDTKIVVWASEQLALSSISTANFTADSQNPVSFDLKGPDSLELELTFANSLAEEAALDFTISAWQDLVGNTLSESIDTSLNTLEPRVIATQFTSDSTVQIPFSKAMNAAAYEASNYTLQGLTIESVSDAGGNMAEIEILGSFSETAYGLTLSNVASEGGNSLQFTSLDLTFETYLSSITILDSLILELQFETEFETFALTNVEVAGQNPDLVSIDPDNPSRIQLLLSAALIENSDISLYWNNLQDRFGRELPDHTSTFRYDIASPSLEEVESQLENVIQASFDQLIDTQLAASTTQYTIIDVGNPQSLEFSNDSTVQLTFSNLTSGTTYQLVAQDIADLSGNFTDADTLEFTYSPPEIITENLVIISEIMADPSPVVGLPEAEYIELFNTSDRTLDLASLRLSNDTDTLRLSAYELASNAYVIIIDAADEDEFSSYNNLPLNNLFSLDNSGELLVLSNINDELVDSLTFSSDWYGDDTKDDGGYSLELIDAQSNCSDENNWLASNNTAGGTPGSANSLDPDTAAPSVASSSLSDRTITINFNEEMNEASLLASAFTISNGLSISSLTTAPSVAEITFSGDLTEGQTFDLSISGVSDCSGNVIADTTLSFIISAIPEAGDLLISEIMADPSPVVGLPEAEYIEIFNASDSIIDLSGLVLAKEGSSTTLTSYNLDPGAYVAVIDVSTTSQFESFNVLAVPDLISFSNSSDSIVLQTTDAQVLDRVEYELAWYGDTEKDNGGYSLELIDAQSNCSDENNWLASNNTAGGTPGSANSLDPDTAAPSVASSSLSDRTIAINFDEEMNEASLLTSAFAISNGLSISSLTTAPSVAEITFSGDLTEGQTFDLSISGITDCSGNVIADTTLSFTISAIPEAGDLLISEIMADPSPVVGLPEAEYIEIFNASDSIIDLSGLVLAKEGSSTTLTSYNLDPGAYVAVIDVSTTSQFESLNVLAVPDLISFSNSSDSIVLQTTDAQVLDRVEYELAWYGDTEKDNGGYSLELIDAQSNCSDENNWLASNNTAGGTPGSANSLDPDTAAPSVASSSLSDRTIAINFNEEMNEASLLTSAFTISNGLSISSLTTAPSVAEITFSGDLTEGQTFDLSISGITDCSGNVIADTTLSFTISAIPEAGDLLISEIMADPSPVVGLPEAEYIEIFNASDSIIDLSGLVLAKEGSSTTLTSYNLDPGAYVAVIDVSTTSQFESLNVLAVPDLISFSNSSDSIVLQTTDAQVLHRVEYELAWYGDTEKDNGGYSLELIDAQSNCSPINSWGASPASTGGTPGTVNAIIAETAEPTIVESILSGNQLILGFSEEMLGSSISEFAQGLESLITASNYNDQDLQLQLTLNETTASLQQIDFNITGLADCSGNLMNDTTVVFLQAIAPTFNDILITEIMSDPDPEVGLPNREYLEIFNRSENILDLNAMVIQDGTGNSAPIGGVIIPGEYQVLVTTSGVSDFDGLNVNGVGSFPGLSNSGEQLTLYYDDELIFRVDYSIDWHDTNKSEGGYALEMRDTNNPCGVSNNWGSSVAEAGGTPGAENAIKQDIPDNFGPNVTRAIAVDSDSIHLEFDEPLIPTLRPVISISDGIEVSGSFVNTDDLSLVTLSLSTPLERGVVYTITVELAQDCLGNAVGVNTAELVLPFEAEASQVLLSEIMFNPLDDGFDFVEVYNTSDQFISLKGWLLGNESQNRVITEEDLIIAPQDYMAFTENVARLKLDFPDAPTDKLFEVADLPGYSNEFGSVYLVDASQIDQDSLFYDEDYHSDLLRSVDGVSLERISFDSPNSADNWNSAASTVNFGTPGAANSQSLDLSAFNDPVEAEPRVFVPGSGSNSFTTINYEFETSGNFANITLYDQNGRFVKELARGISLGADGFIRWDGTAADGGVVRVGYYVIVFEVFNSSGQSQVIKETVVVGRDF